MRHFAAWRTGSLCAKCELAVSGNGNEATGWTWSRLTHELVRFHTLARSDKAGARAMLAGRQVLFLVL